jgi:hypothetical protein
MPSRPARAPLVEHGWEGGATAPTLDAPAEAGDVASADSVDPYVLLEMRLGNLASRTVAALRVGDEALLPLGQFFDLARIRADASGEGRIEARLQPDDVLLALQAGRDTARLDGRPVPLPPGSLVARDGDVFLGAATLGRLLGVDVFVDWSELEVIVPDPSRLPIGVLHAREAARRGLAARSGVEAPSRVLPQERAMWDGLAVDYGVFSEASDPLGGGSWNVAAGADLLGGSLELGAASDGPVRDGRVRMTGSWLGVWRDSRIVRQLRLGDGAATGPTGRALRGVAVTNSPYLRASDIGLGLYGGELPEGWEVEAWRDGRMVAFDSIGTGGDFAFELPVAYGDNPVELVAWGPNGERRVLRRLYKVPTLLLAKGAFEYGISGGACRASETDCSALGNADLRYGLARRWTLRGGTDYWRDGRAHPVLPYAGVAGTFGNAWSVEADAALHGYQRLQLGYEPSHDASLRLEGIRFADTAAGRFNPAGRRAQLRAAAFLRPSRRHESLYFEATAELNRAAASHDEHVRVGAGLRTGAFQFQPYARWDRSGADEAVRGGVTAYLLPPGSWGRVLRGSWLRATAEADGDGATQAGLAFARGVTPSVRAEVGVAWSRGATGPTFTLTLNSLFSAFRSFTTATAPASGPATLAQQVQGSVIVNPRARSVSFTPGPALQRAGIEGRVFVDEDGDGVYDEGESGAAGVRLLIGSGSVTTDSAGRYRTWDVVPFEPTIVEADSLSFQSPLWIATFPTTAVMPGPNRYTTVDVPLVLGAVVEGRVLLGGAGVGGVGLSLVPVGGGARRTATTFSDGGFYVTGLRPGEYEVTIDRASLGALNATAAPARVSVRTGAEAEVPPVDVTLTPQRTGSQ